MSDRAERILKPFQENKAYMEDKIASGIEANRKGFCKVAFVDAEGRPVRGVHADIRQKTHDFRFGANLFMIQEMETEEKNAEYLRRFKEVFNLATIPFYWCDLEPEKGKPRFSADSPKIYRRPAPDICLQWCEENAVEPKLHCLNYDQWTPTWVPNDVPSVKKYLDKRMKEIGERYATRIPGLEVINETLCGTTKTSDRHSTRFFDEPELVEWSFEHARKYFPANKLIINEATQYVWGDYKHNRGAYYMQIERALRKGASIDAVGMQYHMFYRAEEEEARTAPYYDPHVLYGIMDQYADFGKPFQVTEITIPAYSKAPEDEELQAEIIKNLYSVWFSHPNMEAIIYWNLVDGYAAFAPQGDMTYGENYFHGALLRFDMSPKPAFETMKKLVNETWRTNLSLEAENGSLEFKGFYGDYELETLTPDGNSTVKTVHLEKGADNRFTVVL